MENLKRWFKFKFEVIYFYNVYGPGHIKRGSIATVIGIFEDKFKKKTLLLSPVINLEDSLILQIQLMFVLKLGKKINVLTIVYQIVNLTKLLR